MLTRFSVSYRSVCCIIPLNKIIKFIAFDFSNIVSVATLINYLFLLLEYPWGTVNKSVKYVR